MENASGSNKNFVSNSLVTSGGNTHLGDIYYQIANPAFTLSAPETFLFRISQFLFPEHIPCFAALQEQAMNFLQQANYRVLLISGPNESGKTHLLSNLIVEAQQAGWQWYGVEPDDGGIYPLAPVRVNEPLLLCLDDADWCSENTLRAILRYVYSHPNVLLAATTNISYRRKLEQLTNELKDFPGLIKHLNLPQWNKKDLIQLLRMAAGTDQIENETELVEQFPNPYLLKFIGEEMAGKNHIQQESVRKNFVIKLQRSTRQSLDSYLPPEHIETLLCFLSFVSPQVHQLSDLAPLFGLDDAGIRLVFQKLQETDIIRYRRGTWHLFPSIKGDFFIAGQIEHTDDITSLIRVYLPYHEGLAFKKIVSAMVYIPQDIRQKTARAILTFLQEWIEAIKTNPDSLNVRWIGAATIILEIETQYGIVTCTNATCQLVLAAFSSQFYTAHASPNEERPETSASLSLMLRDNKPSIDDYGRFLSGLLKVFRERDIYLSLVHDLYYSGWKTIYNNYKPDTLIADAFKPEYNTAESYKTGLEHARFWLIESGQPQSRYLAVKGLQTLLGGFFEYLHNEPSKIVFQTDGLPDSQELFAVRGQALRIILEALENESLHIDALHIIQAIGGGRWGHRDEVVLLPSFPQIRAEIEALIPEVGKLLSTSQDFLVQKEAETTLLKWWLLGISDLMEPWLLQFDRTPEYLFSRYIFDREYVVEDFAIWQTKAPKENRRDWYWKHSDRREKRLQGPAQYKSLVHRLTKKYRRPEEITRLFNAIYQQAETWNTRSGRDLNFTLYQLSNIALCWAGQQPRKFKNILNNSALSHQLPENARAAVSNYLAELAFIQPQEIAEALLYKVSDLSWVESSQLVVLIMRHQPPEKETWLRQMVEHGPEHLLHEMVFRLDQLFDPAMETNKIAEYLLLTLQSGKITSENFFGKGGGGAIFIYEKLQEHCGNLSLELCEQLRATTLDWLKRISKISHEEASALRFCIVSAEHLVVLISFRVQNWSLENTLQGQNFFIEEIFPENVFSTEELQAVFKDASTHRDFIDKVEEWEHQQPLGFSTEWYRSYIPLKDPETGVLWIEQHLRDALAENKLEKAVAYSQHIPKEEKYVPLMLRAWQQFLSVKNDAEMEGLLYGWATGRDLKVYPVNSRLKMIIHRVAEHFEEQRNRENEGEW